MNDAQLINALKEALTYDGGDRPALVARIPVICNDIRQLREGMIELKNNQAWIKWLLVGIAGGVGVIALKSILTGTVM